VVDVNGTGFLLRQGLRDWRGPLAEAGRDLHFGQELGGVTLTPRLFRFPPRPERDTLPEGARRGAAADLYGNLYVIGEDRRSIDIHPAGLDETGRYWLPGSQALAPAPAEASFTPCGPLSETAPLELRGLTVTALNYLVVGTLDPGGLFVFDLHGGGAPERIDWPAEIAFAPFDMFPATDGGLWILDYGSMPGASRWWRLDRRLRPVSRAEVELDPEAVDSFRPVGGSPAVRPVKTFPSGHDIASAAPDFAPIAIAGLSDETVLVLGRRQRLPHSTLLRMRGGSLAAEVPLDAALLGDLLDPPWTLTVYDMALREAEGAQRGTIQVLAADGNQAFEFAFSADSAAEGDGLQLELLPRYYPVRGFTGRGLVEFGHDTLYDLGPRYVPLVAQPRPRYRPEGSVERLIFDGEMPGLVWHRLAMDACIPEGDGILVESRTAETTDELSLAAWRVEPTPYLRGDGAEIPNHQPFADRDPMPRGAGTWELLFQRAVGRFLELRLNFRGSGRSSPVLRALRVWRPRFSYLEQYLPAVYQEDPDSASFLDRFLANFEGLLTATEGQIAEAQLLFDERTAPDNALAWLAGWLGAEFDFIDDPERRRLLIAHAPLLWAWRGTPACLLALLRIATDECVDATLFDPLRTGGCLVDRADPRAPRLIELFLTRDFSPVALGDPGTLDRPVLTPRGAAYDASQGPEPLDKAYRSFLRTQYGAADSATAALAALRDAWGRAVPSFEAIAFPPVTPEGTAEARDWIEAGKFAFDFVYPQIGLSDLPHYRDFLARRYRDIGRLNAAYRLGKANAYSGFDAVDLPSTVPATRVRLADWLDFVTRATPIRRAAHRFAILMPTDPSERPASRLARMDRARAVIAREKPAHTEFELRFFWSLLQVGAARLGLDTIVGEGARFAAIVLDQTPLGEGFLAESHPWAVRGRRVVGRDAVMEV
jgi:phage tail-like protein